MGNIAVATMTGIAGAAFFILGVVHQTEARAATVAAALEADRRADIAQANGSPESRVAEAIRLQERRDEINDVLENPLLLPHLYAERAPADADGVDRDLKTARDHAAKSQAAGMASALALGVSTSTAGLALVNNGNIKRSRKQ